MIGERDVLVIHDDRMLTHRPDAQAPFQPSKLGSRIQATLGRLFDGAATQWSYPEHPGRLSAITDLLTLEPVPGVRYETANAATQEQLGRVHATSYLETIYALRGKQTWLDVDTTAVSPGSVDAAEIAAGSAIAAVDAAVNGRAGSTFALCRPPGHHAGSVRARGFCLFNNVAVAAAHAHTVLGCERVLIIDWDVHHGNGTQDIFWTSPNVMFFDTHRAAPFYPGTGNKEEVGEGLGEGLTVNVPLPAGCGDLALVHAYREILVPAVEWFQPDVILVSAGFDMHRLDLCMNLSFDGFGMLTRIVQELADKHCNGRLAMILEGGYHLESLSRGVHTVLQVLAGGSAQESEEPGMHDVQELIAFHKEAFR